MIKGIRDKLSHHPRRKRVLRFLIYLLLSLLFLEFFFYFGSNLLFLNWARTKVNEATGGVYQVEFNRLNFSLFRRGVFLNGIVLRPDPNTAANENQVLFDFQLDELGIRNLWFDWDQKILEVGNIRLENPNLSLQLPPELEESDSLDQEEVSAVRRLENEIKKSIDKLIFGGVIIDEILIADADLFFFNFLSKKSINAKNTSLHVFDVDWSESGDWVTPFNAKGFEFELEQVEFSLPDKVHSIFAEKAFVTSLDSRISVEKFSLKPDKTIDAPVYYELFLDELRIGNVDLNRAFRQSELEIDEVILNKPSVQVTRNENLGKSVQKSGDLNELIDGLLKSIYIKELSVREGDFLTGGLLDSLHNRIEAGQVEFKMVEFYLGEDQERRQNQFFYGKDAAMELGEFVLYLSDDYHLIRGGKVMASSFLDRIEVSRFELVERPEINPDIVPNQRFDIKLETVEMEAAELKKLYNEGILDVDRIALVAPEVEITDLRKASSDEVKKVRRNIWEGYLSEANIGNFDLIDGRVQFKNATGLRSDDVAFERISLSLEDVKVSLDSVLEIQDAFLAEEVVLSLDKYRLKLRDNLHVFEAGEVIVDSKRDLIELKDFTLRPENPENISDVLDAYGKSVALNFKVPSFQVRGVDIRAALLEERLDIREIFVLGPEFDYRKYRKTSESSRGDGPSSVDDFQGLLSSYFRSVSIDSVRFEEGKLDFFDFSGRREISFSEEDLSLYLKNFYFEEGMENDTSKTFFSDEIILDLADYSFVLAQGDYDVTTNHLQFDTKKKRLSIDTLTLIPGENLSSKIALSLQLPMVELDGVDLEDFLFNDRLELNRLRVNGSSINLEVNPDYIRNAGEQARRNQARSERRVLKEVSIEEVIATNSNFNLLYRYGQRGEQSINTDFDLSIQDLNLGEEMDLRRDASQLFGQLAISLNEFQFNLPDSIHQLVFSNLSFDSEKDETVLSGITIAPIDRLNKTPFFLEGSIAEIGISNNDLSLIQETGVFDIEKLRISQPKLSVIRDKDAPKIKKESKSNETDSAGLIQSILLQSIEIQEGQIKIEDLNTGAINGLGFNEVNAEINALNWNLTQMGDVKILESLLESKSFLSFGDYEIFTKDSMESIRVGKVVFDGENFEMDQVRYAPTMGRYAYLREKGFQTDAVDLNIDRLRIEGIDYSAYFVDGLIKARKFRGDDFRLDIFRDKRLPLPENVYKPMPQVLLSQAPVSVLLDTVVLENGRIRYQEFTEGSQLPGQIVFEEVAAGIAPAATSTEGSSYPLKELDLIATAKLMGEGEINLQSRLFFEDPYPMDVTLQLGAMPLEKLNGILAKAAFLNTREDAQVVMGDWSFRLDDEEAIGKMRFHYEDLKIDFLDSLTLEKGKGKLALMSFLGNTLIKNNNPRKLFGNTVLSDIYFKRDTTKFVFSTWWKATLSGLKGSVGLGQPAIPVRKEEEE
ncbi:hypothetical protein OU792_10670 [Algoriphagus sp. NF]|uniref:hypothetical protein n=1 Tax=Algoriphagus sp. NF TaxID=2992756 RepID=UPI00237A3FAA|nr:hypothetical protein [Algoriphagus sp. NF]MDE0560451.1 hypothetical protein [Algoriphagus sp. NF]